MYTDNSSPIEEIVLSDSDDSVVEDIDDIEVVESPEVFFYRDDNPSDLIDETLNNPLVESDDSLGKSRETLQIFDENSFQTVSENLSNAAIPNPCVSPVAEVIEEFASDSGVVTVDLSDDEASRSSLLSHEMEHTSTAADNETGSDTLEAPEVFDQTEDESATADNVTASDAPETPEVFNPFFLDFEELNSFYAGGGSESTQSTPSSANDKRNAKRRQKYANAPKKPRRRGTAKQPLNQESGSKAKASKKSFETALNEPKFEKFSLKACSVPLSHLTFEFLVENNASRESKEYFLFNCTAKENYVNNSKSPKLPNTQKPFNLSNYENLLVENMPSKLRSLLSGNTKHSSADKDASPSIASKILDGKLGLSMGSQSSKKQNIRQDMKLINQNSDLSSVESDSSAHKLLRNENSQQSSPDENALCSTSDGTLSEKSGLVIRDQPNNPTLKNQEANLSVAEENLKKPSSLEDVGTKQRSLENVNNSISPEKTVKDGCEVESILKSNEMLAETLEETVSNGCGVESALKTSGVLDATTGLFVDADLPSEETQESEDTDSVNLNAPEPLLKKQSLKDVINDILSDKAVRKGSVLTKSSKSISKSAAPLKSNTSSSSIIPKVQETINESPYFKSCSSNRGSLESDEPSSAEVKSPYFSPVDKNCDKKELPVVDLKSSLNKKLSAIVFPKDLNGPVNCVNKARINLAGNRGKTLNNVSQKNGLSNGTTFSQFNSVPNFLPSSLPGSDSGSDIISLLLSYLPKESQNGSKHNESSVLLNHVQPIKVPSSLSKSPKIDELKNSKHNAPSSSSRAILKNSSIMNVLASIKECSIVLEDCKKLLNSNLCYTVNLSSPKEQFKERRKIQQTEEVQKKEQRKGVLGSEKIIDEQRTVQSEDAEEKELTEDEQETSSCQSKSPKNGIKRNQRLGSFDEDLTPSKKLKHSDPSSPENFSQRIYDCPPNGRSQTPIISIRNDLFSVDGTCDVDSCDEDVMFTDSTIKDARELKMKRKANLPRNKFVRLKMRLFDVSENTCRSTKVLDKLFVDGNLDSSSETSDDEVARRKRKMRSRNLSSKHKTSEVSGSPTNTESQGTVIKNTSGRSDLVRRRRDSNKCNAVDKSLNNLSSTNFLDKVGVTRSRSVSKIVLDPSLEHKIKHESEDEKLSQKKPIIKMIRLNYDKVKDGISVFDLGTASGTVNRSISVNRRKQGKPRKYGFNINNCNADVKSAFKQPVSDLHFMVLNPKQRRIK